MRCPPLRALLLLSPAARAVGFVPVKLSVDSASLQIRCNGKILAEVAGSLPVSESFNVACERGSATGSAVVSLVI